LNNRLVAILAAVVFMLWRKEDFRPAAPLYMFAGVSLSNVVATWSQYEALKYVGFPLQTLGKCGKMIPVMVIGTLWLGKKYTPRDYLSVAIVTGGVMVFMMTGEISYGEDKEDTPYGLALILAYLFFDGFTSTQQERLFRGKMSPFQQMLYVNLCSGLLSLVALMGKGELGSSVMFTLTHPTFLVHSFGLSLCSVCGQLIILTTIKDFGALIYAALMTLRQFMSILLSCIIYMHAPSMLQWLGIGVSFAGLVYNEKNKASAHEGGAHGTTAKKEVVRADEKV